MCFWYFSWATACVFSDSLCQFAVEWHSQEEKNRSLDVSLKVLCMGEGGTVRRIKSMSSPWWPMLVLHAETVPHVLALAYIHTFPKVCCMETLTLACWELTPREPQAETGKGEMVRIPVPTPQHTMTHQIILTQKSQTLKLRVWQRWKSQWNERSHPNCIKVISCSH